VTETAEPTVTSKNNTSIEIVNTTENHIATSSDSAKSSSSSLSSSASTKSNLSSLGTTLLFTESLGSSTSLDEDESTINPQENSTMSTSLTSKESGRTCTCKSGNLKYNSIILISLFFLKFLF
jgi:hypothetical protein